MATQATYLTNIRSKLDETTSGQWSDTELRTWINEAARDIARRTESLQTYEEINVSANTQEYTVNDGCLRVHRVEWRPTGSSNVYPLEYRDFNSMDAVWWASQTTAKGYPTFYTMWGYPPTLKIVLYPTPSEAGKLKVFFYQTASNLATDGSAAGSTVQVPSGYEDLIESYVEYVALRKDRDPRWQESRAIYMDSLQEMIDQTRRWTDQGDFIQIGSSHIPGWLWGGEY